MTSVTLSACDHRKLLGAWQFGVGVGVGWVGGGGSFGHQLSTSGWVWSRTFSNHFWPCQVLSELKPCSPHAPSFPTAALTHAPAGTIAYTIPGAPALGVPTPSMPMDMGPSSFKATQTIMTGSYSRSLGRGAGSYMRGSHMARHQVDDE